MGCSGPRILWIVYNLGFGSDFCFSSPSQFSSSTPPIILTITLYFDDIIITMSSSYNTVPIAQVPFSEVSVSFVTSRFSFIDLVYFFFLDRYSPWGIPHFLGRSRPYVFGK